MGSVHSGICKRALLTIGWWSFWVFDQVEFHDGNGGILQQFDYSTLPVCVFDDDAKLGFEVKAW